MNSLELEEFQDLTNNISNGQAKNKPVKKDDIADDEVQTNASAVRKKLTNASAVCCDSPMFSDTETENLDQRIPDVNEDVRELIEEGIDMEHAKNSSLQVDKCLNEITNELLESKEMEDSPNEGDCGTELPRSKIDISGKDAEKIDQSAASTEHKNEDDEDKSTKDIVSWIQCDNEECQKWRKLDADALEKLSEERWVCSMNTKLGRNHCDFSEEECSDDDNDVDNTLNTNMKPGVIVLAKMPGYPLWPGMIEDDPDFDGCFYVDTEKETMSYHVTFFGKDVSRAWLNESMIRKFKGSETKNDLGKLSHNHKSFSKPVVTALAEANAALVLPLERRVKKFGFLKRFKGKGSGKDQKLTGNTLKTKNKFVNEDGGAANLYDDDSDSDFEETQAFSGKQTARMMKGKENVAPKSIEKKKKLTKKMDEMKKLKKEKRKEERRERKKLKKEKKEAKELKKLKKLSAQKENNGGGESKLEKRDESEDVGVQDITIETSSVEEEEEEPSEFTDIQKHTEQMVIKYSDPATLQGFLDSLEDSKESFSERIRKERAVKESINLKRKEREEKKRIRKEIEEAKLKKKEQKQVALKEKAENKLAKEAKKNDKQALPKAKAEKKKSKAKEASEKMFEQDDGKHTSKSYCKQKETLGQFYIDLNDLKKKSEVKTKRTTGETKKNKKITIVNKIEENPKDVRIISKEVNTTEELKQDEGSPEIESLKISKETIDSIKSIDGKINQHDGEDDVAPNAKVDVNKSEEDPNKLCMLKGSIKKGSTTEDEKCTALKMPSPKESEGHVESTKSINNECSQTCVNVGTDVSTAATRVEPVLTQTVSKESSVLKTFVTEAKSACTFKSALDDELKCSIPSSMEEKQDEKSEVEKIKKRYEGCSNNIVVFGKPSSVLKKSVASPESRDVHKSEKEKTSENAKENQSMPITKNVFMSALDVDETNTGNTNEHKNEVLPSKSLDSSDDVIPLASDNTTITKAKAIPKFSNSKNAPKVKPSFLGPKRKFPAAKSDCSFAPPAKKTIK